MSRGRATPTKIKKLQGTFRTNEGVQNEVEYSLVRSVPEPKDRWCEKTTQIWYGLCKELMSKGLLFVTDIQALVVYCDAIMQYEAASNAIAGEEYLLKTKNTTKPSPWLNVLSDAKSTIDSFGRKFGFSPVDKMKIAIGTKKDAKDPFEEV
jgi:P27 family predicted phage terminase small subunit